MKNNTKIYNRFKGFTLEDCDCRYCLYYGGRRKGKVNCLADECVCAEEIRQAKESYRRERSFNGSYREASQSVTLFTDGGGGIIRLRFICKRYRL